MYTLALAELWCALWLLQLGFRRDSATREFDGPVKDVIKDVELVLLGCFDDHGFQFLVVRQHIKGQSVTVLHELLKDGRTAIEK